MIVTHTTNPLWRVLTSSPCNSQFLSDNCTTCGSRNEILCTYYVEVVLRCKEWNFCSAPGRMHGEALGRQIKVPASAAHLWRSSWFALFQIKMLPYYSTEHSQWEVLRTADIWHMPWHFTINFTCWCSIQHSNTALNK